jgi:formamidopyrimidine-DNA glycosylase
MPELPEVETVCRTIRPFVTGRTFVDCCVYWARTVSPADPGWFQESVAGQRITGVERRAKFIVLRLESGKVLTVHLRMTGELLYVLDGNNCLNPLREPYLRAEFGFENGGRLLFYDIRKFGRIQLLNVAEWQGLDEELGIEPLSDAFTPDALKTLLGSRRRQLKPLLLDQTVIAGLGNIYVDEALFMARLNPLQLSNQVSARKARDLHSAIVTVLTNAIEHRGTTLSDYRGGTGQQGEYQSLLLMYGRKNGGPCPRCGRPVRHITVGQRGTSFCPRCQPLRKPDR